MDEDSPSPDADHRSEASPIVNPHDRTTDAPISDSDRYRLLVPHSHATPVAESTRRVRLAAAIAAERGGDVVVAGLPQVPAETPLDQFATGSAATETRAAIEAVVSAGHAFDVPTRGVVWLSHAASRGIADLVDRYGCNGIVAGVPTDRSHRQRVLSGETIDDLLGDPACDVYLERISATEYAVDRVLLAVAGGPHSALATDTARLVARHHDAVVHAVRVLEPDATEEARHDATELLDDVRERLDDVRHETRLVESADVAEQLVRESNAYDLTVLGGPTVGVLKRFVFGSVPDSVIRDGNHEHAVLMVKRGDEH